MGTSVWVLRRDAVDQKDDFDHSCIFDTSEELDRVAAHLGVRKLSEFFDWTEFDATLSTDEPLEDYEYVAAARWFDAHDAIPAIEALLAHLRESPEAMRYFSQSAEAMSALVPELEDVLAKLRAAASAGSAFNLCVVM
jgi:hypothetical protein